MGNANNLLNVEKIESSFINGEILGNEETNIKGGNFKRLKIRHLLLIPSLLFSNIYRFLPALLKDIFFCFSIIHKSPASRIFAKTRYDELRTKIDVKVSSLAIRAAPTNIKKDLESTFLSGFHVAKLTHVFELDCLLEEALNHSNPSHAGARPYFKDGINKKIENSYSAYYSFSKKNNQIINSILAKDLDENFNYHLSTLAGYVCKLKDITYSLSIVSGANSNDEMHQDTYASVAKGFLYLQDIDVNGGPFEYLEGSYNDAVYRSSETNKAVLKNDTHSSGSTRLRGETLQDAVDRYNLQTFTGPKGLLVFANTAGYHRKGVHNSNKPRIILACGVKRKGVFSKLVINLLSMIKLKLTH